MTREEMAEIEALRQFAKVAMEPGFERFQDAIRDRFDEATVYPMRQPPRAGWTLGEEFAFREGERSAVLTILSLREILLTKARELVQREGEAPGLEETTDNFQ